MNDFVFDALRGLYNGQWTEDLLSNEFGQTRGVLAKRERIVLELKIQFYEEGLSAAVANAEIGKLLKIKPATLNRVLYDIKHVFRHGLPRRVDNKMHPEIHRAKRKKERLQRYGYSRPHNENSILDSVRTHDGRETWRVQEGS